MDRFEKHRAELEAVRIVSQVIAGFPRESCLDGLDVMAQQSEFYVVVKRMVRRQLDADQIQARWNERCLKRAATRQGRLS